MKRSIYIIASVTMSALSAFGQNVSNVDFYIDGPKVIVTYDLDKNADVYLFASTFASDGWNTSYMNYSAYRAMPPALRAVAGDIGKNVAPGHKTAIWYFKEEVSCFFVSDPETGIARFEDYTAMWEKQIREKRVIKQEEASRYEKTSIAPDLFNSLQMKVEAHPTTSEPEMVYIDGCDGDGDFWMGKYEVTVSEFAAFVNETNYVTDAERKGYAEIWSKKRNNWEKKKGIDWRYDETGNLRPINDYPFYPVVNVSHNDAESYCEWLCQKFNKGYHLPDFVDWINTATAVPPSYVYHGATGYAGSTDGLEVGWFAENSDYTIHKIGTKAPNRLHIYDMSGNVYEWLYNEYDDKKDIMSERYQDPIGDCSIGAGGSCFESMSAVEDTKFWKKDVCGANIGFRVMMHVRSTQNWITGEFLEHL